MSFSGETLELRGWLRTRDVAGFAGLWLREDGPSGPVEFDNMRGRGPSGTTGWTEYRVVLPLAGSAQRVALGALLVGEGTVWVDDLELLVDGVDHLDAPPAVENRTSDQRRGEPARGSGIETTRLSDTQVESLTLLGKVWGFTKYHHPRVTGGDSSWDQELFRIAPRILEAEDRAAALRAMSEWLAALGDPPACEPCVRPPAEAHLVPRIDWIRDSNRLGAELSARLQAIHESRRDAERQRYVAHDRGVGNPDFSGEAAFGDVGFPDAGHRLLALFRFWNIVEYWFPYRDVLDEDWDAVLAEFVPRLMGADEVPAYELEVMQLISRVDDTHANLWSSLASRPPRGDARLPVTVRFVEDEAVVAGYAHPELGPATGLRAGDVLDRIDGQPIDSLVEVWRPHYAASNEAARMRDVARTLTSGDAGPVRVSGRRVGAAFDLTARRVPVAELDERTGLTHDLPGEAFRMLTDEVAYLELSSVVSADAAEYVERARGARVLVIDIRNYPREFVVFTLGGHLVAEPTEFARFTRGDPRNPGAFVWSEPVALQPREPRFQGTVVILVDEATQSQAEYTAMAFRASPGAIVVGSTTAGADGNVSPISLPGGLRTMISGIGVFYPDRSPTQRVGIVPDLVVRPTIAGIAAGRDEVLEAGVTRALGRRFRLPPG